MAENIVSNTSVQKAGDYYSKSVTSSLENAGFKVTPTQKQCVIFAVQKLYELLAKEKMRFNDLDQSSIHVAFTQVALTEINMMSLSAHAYFVIRGRTLLFDTMSDGARAIVRKFGVNVKDVLDPWIVREGDKFKYPEFKGLTKTEPEWTPSGTGKCVRVVVPIIYNDGKVEFKISEREDVKPNLLSHISQNVTQGKDRDINLFNEIFKATKNMTLDEILDNQEILIKGRVSPGWRGVNREQMIITKMVKNALKRVEIDMKFFEAAGGALYDENNEEQTVIDISSQSPKEEPKELPQKKEKTLELEDGKKAFEKAIQEAGIKEKVINEEKVDEKKHDLESHENRPVEQSPSEVGDEEDCPF